MADYGHGDGCVVEAFACPEHFACFGVVAFDVGHSVSNDLLLSVDDGYQGSCPGGAFFAEDFPSEFSGYFVECQELGFAFVIHQYDNGFVGECRGDSFAESV